MSIGLRLDKAVSALRLELVEESLSRSLGTYPMIPVQLKEDRMQQYPKAKQGKGRKSI